MILDRLGKELLYLDGAMGTLLQQEGLRPGEYPESWNLEHPDVVKKIHQSYLEAGSDIVLTNTFGANKLKYHDDRYALKDVVEAAVRNAKEAAKAVAGDRETYVALDMGSTGKLLKPVGELEFEDAYDAFRELVEYGAQAGADLIHIETMSDTYETKAAVLAAKENSNLPVFVTVILDENGKLLTGGDVPVVVAMLEGLRVDALGLNCGMGPKEMLPLLKEIRKYTSLPVIIKPNAGLPQQRDGKTCYDVLPDDFAASLQELVKAGANVVGGCCGTTPEHIRAMVEACKKVQMVPPDEKNHTLVTSYGQAVDVKSVPIIIGERINPTGKKKFKQALQDMDFDYILGEGFKQLEAGAHVLDVNVGLPDIDEVFMMEEAVKRLQSVIRLPLQIDTVDEEAMEAAMRIYNGKPMVNSVSGKQASMDSVFPLIQKYGGVVVGLTLDEDGIPSTAQGRVAIAEKIIKEAAKYGIASKDIVIDVLTMTISSEPDGALVTLEALRQVRERFGVGTVLGVSNISFGLPERGVINSHFYTLALQAGLTAGIINPSSEDMMNAYTSYLALQGLDENCSNYITRFSNQPKRVMVQPEAAVATQGSQTNLAEKPALTMAVEKGWKAESVKYTKELLENQVAPLDVIDQYLIPALDFVGKGFEDGTVFLPQLLMSAEAAKSAFGVLKEAMAGEGDTHEAKDKIILATVKGDIHDIGKNIVKVLLENYGFDVIDLGKDVPPEVIVKTACEFDVALVGLSALMTTTVVSMEETIKLLKENKPDCKVVVGGAVLNQSYADMIGADHYAKDAMQTVYYAQEIFGK